jgi:hypothetical protein
MTSYGSTSYYISISTGISGTTPSSYPTGDIVYLYAKRWEQPNENKDKVKQMANDNSYNNRMGKMAREFNMTECVITDEDGFSTTNTGAINNIRTFIDTWCGLQASAVYVIVTPLVDNSAFVQPNTNRVINLQLTRSHDYMKGVPMRFNIKAVGNVYMMDIAFKETSLY